jgi:ABC-2 type transport system permease protein
MEIVSYIKTIGYLLQTDFKILSRSITNKLIDLFIWIISTTWITVYLLPAFGLNPTYGNFLIASIIATAGLFELFASVTNLISDFTGDNITAFYLTLPIPSWYVFLRLIIFYTLNGCLQGLLVIPVCKLTAWSFPLAEIHIFKFFLIFIFGNLFYATFTLWTTSQISNIENIGSVYMRFVYPIWIFGGYQYSWNTLHSYSPILATISLINPVLYIIEGTRAAILGHHEFLNYWLCIVIIIFFTFVSGWHGIMRLKKQLDF